MLIQSLWVKNLSQAVSSDEILVDKSFVYITEKGRYISKIDIESGELIWSKSLPHKT